MRYLAWIGVASLVLGMARPAGAVAPSGAIGLDLYNGPNGQQTRSALALGGLSFDAGDVLGGLMRFDDTTVGPGYGLVLGGGVPLGGPTSLRVLASRFVGDRDYRAWRVKTGPQWALTGGGTLGLFWVHDTNNLGADTESGAGDLAFPVVHGWTGKLAGAYGRSGDTDGYAASIGAAWALIPHLELGGDVGVARNPPATSPGPSRGILDPILGGSPDPSPSTSNELATTSSLSLRVTLP